jgi:5-methyltetrahydrofolate--homocysteine methyltransferase
MADLKALADALINGKRDEVTKLVKEAMAAKVPVANILSEGLIAGMSVVGDKFKKNEFYVPEVLVAARAMNAGMAILEPELIKAGVKPVAKVAIGTVKGDLHDIGKNLVAMMLKGGGFQVNDLGIDVDPDKYLKAAQEGCKLICLSALLTTTMPQMAVVVKKLKEAGVKDAKVMIGGAPVTQKYADEIGAHGYAPDAASAVDKARELIGV